MYGRGQKSNTAFKKLLLPPSSSAAFPHFLGRNYGCCSTNRREPGPSLRAPKNNNFLNTGYSLAGASEHRARARVFSFSPVSGALLCNYWRHCWQRSRPCGRRGQTDGTAFPWYPFTHGRAAPHADWRAGWRRTPRQGGVWEMFMHRKRDGRML